MSLILHRLCILKQCYGDIQFLCHVLRGMSGDDEDGNALTTRTAASLAERLNAIGGVLRRLRPLPDLKQDIVVAKCCLDLSVPLYERVSCSVPLTFLNEDDTQMQGIDLDSVR